MKSIFDKVSNDCSKLVIKRYSTSFYFSSRLLSKSIRQDIFNIYGFVRLADEIVDTFHEFPKKELLEEFERELWRSVENKISLNPILNSFQYTVNKYSIPKDLITSFLESMKMDLEKKEYSTVEEYKKYIYGSADVVGLMCLKVFVKGSKKLYNTLSPFAISLGSAFQKINFLRDLKDDSNILNRVYFPNVDMNNFNEESKREIILEIEKDFINAVKGIVKLPKNSKFAVYIAYRYYNKLLKKLKRTSSENIVKKRIRIHNLQKFIVIARSYVKYQLNLIQWI
ncbi:MAG: phytoene/squalene synthase family protein [Cryomorphaceae bacterium]|jgi:phytoene/squalene synthetase|nr:phytoene/squalene synthase family protein [Cryomorphaceae bacterium]MBT3503959.1 phytoene/squalene synthase family protein [Cryomorphaceae bacterium]MBT4834675.1 phytoene/squalene synthase family protein [Cryomorphaceae bacterium]MBT5936430.1 phytoene/squalene synthase family protein [Cryomorphaceae bacterium]MBT6214344.1 phytoene/squalene synthase family protein [Cryomorphaceae bacterium]